MTETSPVTSNDSSPPKQRPCNNCKLVLPLTDFHKGAGTDGRRQPCRKCILAYAKAKGRPSKRVMRKLNEEIEEVLLELRAGRKALLDANQVLLAMGVDVAIYRIEALRDRPQREEMPGS